MFKTLFCLYSVLKVGCEGSSFYFYFLFQCDKTKTFLNNLKENLREEFKKASHCFPTVSFDIKYVTRGDGNQNNSLTYKQELKITPYFLFHYMYCSVHLCDNGNNYENKGVLIETESKFGF